MNESVLVGVMQGVGHSRHQHRGVPIIEPLAFQPFRQVGLVGVFRDNVAGAVLGAAHVTHRDDAGMVEIGDHSSLGQIRFRIFGLRDQPGVRHLEGDGPVQLLTLSEIDKAKAPLAQRFLNAVATDPLGIFGRCSTTLRVSFPFVILRHIECIRFVHGCRRPPHPCPAFSSPLYQVRV